MKILFSLMLLGVSLFADVSVEKTALITKASYPDSSVDELKKIVLQKAKLEATKEIFGEFLLSETVMENGQIINDRVRAKHGGVVHIKGEPHYVQTANTIRVTILAYATQKDIDDVSAHKITLTNFIYSNPDLAIKDIKKYAKDAFILEAISRKKPSVSSVEEAKKLALEVDITSEEFNMQTLSYQMSGTVTYIPAFLKDTERLKQTQDRPAILAPQKIIKKEKKDFYGTWSGFVMSRDGYSSSVEIHISSFAQASIAYKSLNCGGNLILQEKDISRVVFKQKITFGGEFCKDNSIIVLQKVTPKSLLFMQENESKKLFNGRVYLVE